MGNIVDPDQLLSSDDSWSESTLISKQVIEYICVQLNVHWT